MSANRSRGLVVILVAAFAGVVFAQHRSLQYTDPDALLETYFDNELELFVSIGVQNEVGYCPPSIYDYRSQLLTGSTPPGPGIPNVRVETWANALQATGACGDCDDHHYGFPHVSESAAQTANMYALSAGAYAISFSALSGGTHTGSQWVSCCGPNPPPNMPGGPTNDTDANFSASIAVRRVVVPRAGTISVVRAYASNLWSNCDNGRTSLVVNGSFDGLNVSGAFYTTECESLEYAGPSAVPIEPGVYDFVAGLYSRHFLNARAASCNSVSTSTTVGDGKMFVYIRYTPNELCDGDVNGDGHVDGDDMDILLYCYGTFVESDPTCGDADLDGDGDIDQDDLDAVIFNFGNDCN